jgi:PEP-CTERM motif-containing protein
MNLSRILCLFLFVACSAISCFAQTDPVIVINLTDPVCNSGTMICYDGTSGAPLVESFLTPEPFTYVDPTAIPPSPIGTQPLMELFITLQNIPQGTELQCQTNIWLNCFVITTSDSSVVNLHLFGAGTFDQTKDTGGTCSFCIGELLGGQGGTFDIKPLASEAPEPTAMLLFGTGLCTILFAAKRRLTSFAVSGQTL